MLQTIAVQESIQKKVVPFGNGSIVYTPKKWIGKQVLVILEEQQPDIEGDVMEMLKPHLSAVEGVFLFGSFARKENKKQSDIDILVITNKKFSLHNKGLYDFLVITKQEFIKRVIIDPTLFLYQAIHEAKPIFNQTILTELKKIKIKPDFNKFLDSTLGAFKNIQKLLEANQRQGKTHSDSEACIYSLILRLRGLFIIQCFFKKQLFTTHEFEKFIKQYGFTEAQIKSFLIAYRAVRDANRLTTKIQLDELEKLFEVAKLEFIRTEKMISK